jgi:MerR family copper efflux transcriptional regulator
MNHRTHATHKYSNKLRPATADNEQGLRIEEVTARAGVSERLVRHCEDSGLIPIAEGTDTSGHRYTHEDVCVLSFARRAHVLGFGMNEVARLLSLRKNMHRMSSEVKSIVLSQRIEPESLPSDLHEMESVLDRLANKFSMEHQPPCPISEELMELRSFMRI